MMEDVLEFNEVNERLEAEGKEPATGEQIMLGITKSISGHGFLPFSSFFPGDDKSPDRSGNQRKG